MRLMRPVMPANLLGLPAAAVPAGKAAGTARRRAGHGRPLPGAGLPRGRGGDRERVGRRQRDRPDSGGVPLASRASLASDSEGRDMRTTTTAVLAVGATALAIPTTAAHAQSQSSVQAPLAGHLTVASQMEAEHTELAQQRLTRKAWRLADRVADARDRGFSPRAYRRRVSDEPPARLARRVRALRRDLQDRPRAERRRAGRRRLPHARGDRRLRVRRQPRHGHRQRVLRQVPVHALDLAERRRQRQPRRRVRGRTEPPRGGAVRARGRLAVAGLRPLVDSGRWLSVTSSPSCSGSRI